MAQARRTQPRRAVPPPGLSLQMPAWQRTACAVLNVLPLPGAGAAWAGWRNPHTGLLRRGILQSVLVVFGTWPLIVPGAAGLAWAVWDAVRIWHAPLLPRPPPGGTDPSDDATAQKGPRR